MIFVELRSKWRPIIIDSIFMISILQEKLVEKNYYLHQSARDAYRSYILAYNSHAMKDIFNVHRLDLQVIYIWTMLSLLGIDIRKSLLMLGNFFSILQSKWRSEESIYLS